jgi:hypothetical protein
MIGISARPLAAIGKITPIFGMRGRGSRRQLADAVVEDLLQLLTAAPSTSRHFVAAQQLGRFRSEADVNFG